MLFLELLVLVIGNWGAFQLERWGEDRREARQQFIFLQQLRDETHNAIANAVQVQQVYQDVMALLYPTGKGL